MAIKTVLAAGEELMKRTIEKFRSDLSSIRTGRASVALVENVKVESYGTMMPINQMAGLSIPDARTIEIRPWDISQLQYIEKALLKSDLGMTPANDGKVIRLSVPTLTEERRKEIIKSIGKIAEEFKIAIRNERRQMVENIKKAEKENAIAEDERKKGEVESQKLTDSYIKKIEDMLAVKQKDLMEL
ncbi:MAG: ribosome recycling factor [Endomicrobiales bacterium]